MAKFFSLGKKCYCFKQFLEVGNLGAASRLQVSSEDVVKMSGAAAVLQMSDWEPEGSHPRWLTPMAVGRKLAFLVIQVSLSTGLPEYPHAMITSLI